MNLSFLKQKKFGLPVWAWVGISAVLIFGIYYYIKKRQGSSSNSSTSPSTATPDNSNVPLSTLPFGDSGSGDGGGSSFFSPPLIPNSTPPILVELAQPDSAPNGGSTTPPSNPSVSLSGAAAIPATSIGQAASAFINSPGGVASSEPAGPIASSAQAIAEGNKAFNQIETQTPIKTVNTTKTIPTSVFQPVKPVKSLTEKPLY